jgi:uncharacterized protein YjbJ (UPF0337 family)
MGLLDKILGRDKKAAGDVTGDTSMQHEGAAEDHAAPHEDMAQEQPQQAEAQAERENT